MKGHEPLVLKKEIKDACPKKVCHMLTRHVKKIEGAHKGPMKKRGHMKVPRKKYRWSMVQGGKQIYYSMCEYTIP